MEILQQTFLDNSYQAWLLAIALGIFAAVALRALQAIVKQRLSKLAARTETHWDDYAAEMIGRTKWLFLLIFGAFAGSLLLDLPSSAHNAFRVAFAIAFFIQAGIWAGVLLQAVLTQYRKERLKENPADTTTLGIIGFIGQTVLWSIIVLLVLDNLGVDVTALVAGLGIGGVAVALALQNILGDLFASLSIVLDKPFVVGDFLSVGDLLGSVERVGLKTTRLRSLSGEQLVFSNTDLLGSRVRNFGRMYERRVVFNIGVTYQTPREKLQLIPGIIKRAIEGEQKTRFDRSHFMNYGDFSLQFESVYYVLTPDYNAHMDIQQSIYFKIHQAFEEQGIEFAYPTQTLHLARDTTANGESGSEPECAGVRVGHPAS
jgi:small-conductance mechanosensitive channel